MTPQSDEPSRTGTGWLVPEQLTPEAIGLLAKLMAELQQAAKILANKACPKLSTCQRS